MKIIRPQNKTEDTPQEDGRNLKDYYAGFNARLMATTIDIILLTPIILLLLQLRSMPPALQELNAKLATGQATPQDLQIYYLDQGGLAYMLGNTLVDTLIVGIIVIGLWRWLGATPGKKLLGMKIVDEKTLEPASLMQHLLRFVGYIISSAVLFVGFIWVAFDKQKQGWHDKLSGTLVLYNVAHDKAWKDKHFKRQTLALLAVLTAALLFIVARTQG